MGPLRYQLLDSVITMAGCTIMASSTVWIARPRRMAFAAVRQAGNEHRVVIPPLGFVGLRSISRRRFCRFLAKRARMAFLASDMLMGVMVEPGVGKPNRLEIRRLHVAPATVGKRRIFRSGPFVTKTAILYEQNFGLRGIE